VPSRLTFWNLKLLFKIHTNAQNTTIECESVFIFKSLDICRTFSTVEGRGVGRFPDCETVTTPGKHGAKDKRNRNYLRLGTEPSFFLNFCSQHVSFKKDIFRNTWVLPKNTQTRFFRCSQKTKNWLLEGAALALFSGMPDRSKNSCENDDFKTNQ